MEGERLETKQTNHSATLLAARTSQGEIERLTGGDCKTIRLALDQTGLEQNSPPRLPDQCSKFLHPDHRRRR